MWVLSCKPRVPTVTQRELHWLSHRSSSQLLVSPSSSDTFSCMQPQVGLLFLTFRVLGLQTCATTPSPAKSPLKRKHWQLPTLCRPPQGPGVINQWQIRSASRWHRLVTPQRLKWEGCKSEAILSYSVKPFCLKVKGDRQKEVLWLQVTTGSVFTVAHDVGVQVITEKEVQGRRPDRRQGTLQTVRITSPERFHLLKAPQPSKAVL